MTFRRIRRRIAALFGAGALDRELADEVRFHIAMETEELMRMKRLSQEEAERQARVRFGGVDRHTEAQRDERGVRPLDELAGDFRYAARTLKRSPGFAISAILVLTLGIGAATAIFSAVNAVIVSHLPYREDDRLVRIYIERAPNRFGPSVADLRGIEEMQRSFSDVGAMVAREIPVRAGAAEPTRLRVAPANAGLFNALGVRVAVGRPLTKADEDPGAAPVVIISDAFARANYGSASGALDKTLDLDGSPSRVIGVLASGVHDLAGVKAEVWPSYQPQTPQRRGPFGLAIIGRLKPGTSLQAATADLRSVSQRVFPRWSKNFTDSVATYAAVPLRQAIVRDAPKTLWLFAAAAALLLLTAMTNVTNLMLARTASRTRELSLRLVLGASRPRVARLVVAESLLVSGAGAAGGLLLGAALLKALVAVSGTMPRLSTAHVDMWSVGFAAAAAVVTALVIGIHPALTLLRGSGAEAVQGSHREIAGLHGSRIRAALVAVEFALALPLLAAAGQLVGSLKKLQAVDPGFDPSHVAYLRVVLPQARYDSVMKVTTYWELAAQRVATLPGVRAAGYSTELPPADISGTNDFRIEGNSLAAGASSPVSPWMTVSPGYFAALGIKLLDGRMFTALDTSSKLLPMIVSESWAKRYSPDRPAIGRRVYSGGCDESCTPEYIVGIVSDVKYEGLANNGEAAYEPGTQGMQRSGFMFVKTSGPPAAALPMMRSALAQLDPAAPIDQLSTLEDRLYESTAAPRHWATLITGFAVAALALAAVGIFGLLSYLVMMMRREIGVRVALGAQRREIAGMVLKRGLVNSAVGAVVGAAIAVAGKRVLASSLYGEAAGDPGMLAVTAFVLLVVAGGACLLPALKAARVDPMEAIRDG
jgi:predicted permease